MKRKPVYILLLVGAVWGALNFYNKFRIAPALKLDALALVDLDNRSVNMTSFRGKKIVLSFGASWCGNCIEELETLKKLKSEELKDVEVIIVSDEPLERVAQFKARRNYPFTFLKMLNSFGAIGINAIPTSYIINSNFEVKKESVGYIHWEDPSTRNHLKILMQ